MAQTLSSSESGFRVFRFGKWLRNAAVCRISSCRGQCFKHSVFASELSSNRFRFSGDDSLSDSCPSFFQVALGSCQLKVVNVHNPHKVKSGVSKATFPIWKGNNTNRDRMFLSMLFPIVSSIGVTIRRSFQQTHRINACGHTIPLIISSEPFIWPPIFR